jgi:hypothetical protein
LTCEITNVLFAASMVNAKAYLELPGVLGMHASAAAGRGIIEQKGMILAQGREISHGCLC